MWATVDDVGAVHHLLKRLLDQGLLRRHRQLGSWRRAGQNDDVPLS